MNKEGQLTRIRLELDFCYKSILKNRLAIEASWGINEKLKEKLELKHKRIGGSIANLIQREIKLRETPWERL
jgi:hypothetical protein